MKMNNKNKFGVLIFVMKWIILVEMMIRDFYLVQILKKDSYIKEEKKNKGKN